MVGLILLTQAAFAEVRIDPLTEVRSVHFTGVHSVPERDLRDEIQTRGRSWTYGPRAWLGKLPFISSPGPRRFSPLVLQQDVVRIRNAYAAAGFRRAQVHYDVEQDDAKNLLDITFVIEEGKPFVLVDVAVRAADSLSVLPVPEGERKSWEKLERSVLEQRGKQLDVERARKGRTQLRQWWRDRGYPQAWVAARFQPDSVRYESRLTYVVTTGSFVRFGDIQVEGNQSIDDATVRRQTDIKPGAPYSEHALEQAVVGIEALDIVRLAKVDVPALGSPDSSGAKSDSLASAPVDSVLTVRVRITEADRRLVSGDVGYVTDGGLSSQASLTHRNFTGGGRSLTFTGLAQTGWLALDDNPDKRYRLAVSLKQPAVFNRRTSLMLTPFVEKRDDVQDRSLQYGVNTTLVNQLGKLTSVSLDYQLAQRKIYEYRFGDLASGDIDLLTFLTQAAQGALDSLGSTLNTSALTLSASVGSLDDPANPRRGGIVRPAIQITVPPSSTSYWRFDASANGFLPLGPKAVLASRLRFGQLSPFGKSVPGEGDDPTVKFLQLRDASFTAGGTGDVRGWENRMLGPKVPDIRFREEGDSLVVDRVEGYVPYGAFARTTFSLELRLPFPMVPKFGSILFLDGGKVWTNDSRFNLEGDPYGQEEFFFATGAGINMRTPVGPIELSVGYKLNPSVTDVVEASDLLAAAESGEDINSLPKKNSRRWQFHLSIGTSY